MGWSILARTGWAGLRSNLTPGASPRKVTNPDCDRPGTTWGIGPLERASGEPLPRFDPPRTCRPFGAPACLAGTWPTPGRGGPLEQVCVQLNFSYPRAEPRRRIRPP